ncbi:hypothetical protein KFL_001480170 [Klebsormidium nitens]|uniref:N-acetyltransferase domain-containing protein n=1 Tax=Klebsormidium nitens TaxID=105231 RepID=A0A1Y1I5Q4_KLENI|nr:hypothetical protein KFL_001480170 [Klebsormidium nitens]|eukprot:GAQ83448.1 hypothetical protein KFL_001480170 [Klebsormidium nitens]
MNASFSRILNRKALVFTPLAKSTVEDAVTLEKAPSAASLKQAPIPTFEDFVAAGTEKGVEISLNTLGPVFWIEAKAAVDGIGGPAGKLLGSVNGFVLPWPGGNLLHLDTMRVAREVRQLLELSLILGGAMLRHGYDRGCKKAELLAINDTDVFHRKLVNYYRRIGFTKVHEVTGGLSDIPHMLVWGGLGTRMDADIETILRKWSKRFARGSSGTIGDETDDRTMERTQ